MSKKIVISLLGMLIIALAFTGCGKDEPAETPESSQDGTFDEQNESGEESVDGSGSAESEKQSSAIDEDKASQEAEKAMADALALIESAQKNATVQKTCPVMGGDIKRDIFVEYKGKKVYFCCPPCKEKFNADPEKYLSKLPQFEN